MKFFSAELIKKGYFVELLFLLEELVPFTNRETLFVVIDKIEHEEIKNFLLSKIVESYKQENTPQIFDKNKVWMHLGFLLLVVSVAFLSVALYPFFL